MAERVMRDKKREDGIHLHGFLVLYKMRGSGTGNVGDLAVHDARTASVVRIRSAFAQLCEYHMWRAGWCEWVWVVVRGGSG